MVDHRLVAGLDLGGTKLLGVVLDPAEPSSTLLLEDRVPTPHAGAEVLLTSVADMVGGLRRRAKDELDQDIDAVGLGAPGLVDREGRFRFGANLPGIVDVDLGGQLRALCGLPVAVDNDSTCAAWGEHERGASRGKNHTLLVTLGTGIGAGITVNGEVLRGANGFAGEPGHMIVDPNGLPCPCGQRGCWERYASGTGLGRLAREAATARRLRRGVELAGGDPEDVKGEHVTQAAREGDPEALEVLGQFAWWVALGVANLVNILDSEIVVIGGGLVEAGRLVINPTRDAYRELVYGGDRRPDVPIRIAELGERAGAIGAALLAAERAL
jgi:glucokinase